MLFIVDLLRRVLLRWVVVLSSWFSHFDSLDGKVRSDKVNRSNLIYQYATNMES